MPAVGVLLGHGVGMVLGRFSGYIAAIVIGIAGLIMLRLKKEDGEDSKVKLLAQANGLTIINLGISISLDELAIGFSLGILHISLLFVVVYIAIQAFLAARLGMWLGGRLSERFRSSAERLGGIILVLIAFVLIVFKITGHQI